MSYIQDIRQKIGHDLLIYPTAGVIVVKDRKILLQKRRDPVAWAVHGGGMEAGESFEETARRELFEETGLQAKSLELFALLSGEERFLTYANGDQTYMPGVFFVCREFTGQLKGQVEEVSDLAWFSIDEPLPEPLFSKHEALLVDFILKENN